MRGVSKIFPNGRWMTDPNGEISALILSSDVRRADTIVMTIRPESLDEFGDQVFAGAIEGPEEIGGPLCTESGEVLGPSAQDVADQLVGEVASWMMERATPAQMLAYVPASGLYGADTVQSETAAALGVAQPTVSNWLAGNREMQGAVRAHIMRMCGLARLDRKWVLWHTQDA